MSQPERSDNDEVEESIKKVKGMKKKMITIYDKHNEKIEVVNEVIFNVIEKGQKDIDVKEKLSEKVKKVPVQRSHERVNSEKNPLDSLKKANASIRDNHCIILTYFVVLRSRVNHSGYISSRSVMGHKSVIERMKEEELNLSNYSNKSHLESSDKAKLAGHRIAFIRHDSYI